MSSVEVQRFMDRMAGGALDTITVARMETGRASLGLDDPKVRELAHYIALGTLAHLVSEATQADADEALEDIMQKVAARWLAEAQR